MPRRKSRGPGRQVHATLASRKDGRLQLTAIQSDTNCSVPIYRDDDGRRPPLQPDAQTFMSLWIVCRFATILLSAYRPIG